MKIKLIIPLLFFINSFAQKNTLNCLDSVSDNIREIHREGPNGLYYLDNNFFLSLREDSPEYRNTLKFTNLNISKSVSVTITKIKLAGMDKNGKVISVTDILDQDIEFLNNQSMNSCSSAEIGFNFEIPDSVGVRVLYMKIKLEYANNETIIELGSRKDPEQ